MSLRVLIAAVASVAVVGTASAQYPGYSYSYTNPYSGYTAVSSYGYNPYTSAYSGYSATYNPWTGYGTRTAAFNNPWTGVGVRTSAYNAFTGAYYGNRYGFNPYFGGYNYFRASPGFNPYFR